MRPVREKLTDPKVLVRAVLVAVALMPTIAAAQQLGDVKPSPPLTLKGQGSFYIDGNTHAVAAPTAVIAGNSMINQMYVQFQLPLAPTTPCPRSFRAWLLLELEDVGDDARRPHGLVRVLHAPGLRHLHGRPGWARAVRLRCAAIPEDALRRGAAPFTDRGRNGVGCINTARPVQLCGLPVSPAGRDGTTIPSILIATDMFAWNVFRYGPPCTIPCGAFTTPPSILP